ncbi:MAG: S-layer homology domain-containing protein [Oscillospiraceae bacterium]
MKKLLALVLALVMSMSLVTISNAAFKDADKIDYKEAVDVMNAVGVFIGDEKGNFNAKENLTREQAAKIIAYLELGEKAADALVGGATFTDVASTRWSAGFVGYCAKAGVVAGYDGKFDPAGQLTALQFGKMLLVELGYDAKAAGMVGADWAINTSKLMAKAKLMDGIDGSVNQVLTREKAAQMCLNALEAPTVEYTTKGSSISVNGAEINLGASEPSYVTNTIAKEQTISSEKLTNNGGYTIELGEKLYKNLKKISTTDDFGRPATKWTWKSESVGTYADAADLSYTKAVKAGDIYKDLNLSDTVAAKNVTVWVNGEQVSAASLDIKKGSETKIGAKLYDDKNGTNGNGVLTEVFYDDVADTMVITQIVTYIGEVAKTVKATDKRDAYVVITAKTGDNNAYTMPKDSKGIKASPLEFETDETFADDTYVLYTYSFKAEAVKSLAAAEKVEGYVTKTINSASDLDKNNGMTISGTEYKMSLATAGEALGNVSVKNDYTVYLDQYGYIIYVEQVQELGSYALVLATANKGSFIGNKAQLLLTDGTVKFVDTDENYASGTKKIPNNTIVTFRENSDKTYTLRAVKTTQTNSNDKEFSMTNDLAGITVETNKMVYANSASQFVVSDKKDYTSNYANIDDWTAYTGIKNAPTVKSAYGTPASYADVDVYYYCKSGSMVTVMFIIPSQNATVIDGSKTSLYLSQKSRSDLIHDTDGDYFTYNAVVDGKIETVKVDVDAKCGSTTADKLDGLYSDYTVSSKGYITGLTQYGTYDGTSSAKAALNSVTGIDKTSKEYTVIVGGKTITCADDMKVFYVDKNGNITESSYAAIYPDTNDLVYAVVDKYLVKTLVIFEVEDKGAASGKFDPANPQKAYIDGYTVVIPKVDDKKVDNIANVLADNGYTVTGLMGGTVMANKNGVTYFFTESNPEYYTLTVNGTVVEYMAKGTASKISEKEFAAKYDTDGTAYKSVKGGTTYFLAYAPSSANAMTDGTATVVIETGYVTVTDNTSATLTGVTEYSGTKYAKVNSDVTVKYAAVAANSSVTLTYTVGSGADQKITKTTGNAAADVTFTVSGDKNIVLKSKSVATSYAITLPAEKTTNGVTVKFEGPAKAVAGQTVTVTAKLTGKATGGDAVFTLSGHSIDTAYAGTFTGVSKSAAGQLTVANNTDLGAAGLEVTFTFTMPASDATISIA